MKVRNGFVSNSSSSSFIIQKDEEIRNVFDLAELMLPIVEYKPQLKEILNRLKTSDKDPNTSVRFYSCNFDTFIKNYGDYILVDTCNNEDWNLWDRCVNLPEFETSFDEIMSDEKFWCLETDIVFKQSSDYQWCDKKGCGGEFINIMGEDQCPHCFTLKNGEKKPI